MKNICREKSGDHTNKLENNSHHDDDRKILLHIFPLEIWDLVLGKLKGSVNFRNLSNSSQFFHERLSSQRTIFLFPELLELLIKMFRDGRFVPKNANDIASNTEGSNLEDLVWIFPLELRLVCSKWNTALEEYLQRSQVKPCLTKCKLFQGIGFEDAENEVKMLAKFGPAFKCAELYFNARGNYLFYNSTQVYSLLVIGSKLLVNVKDLKIIYYTDHNGNDGNLSQTIASKPISKMRSLENDIFIGNLPSQIFTEILHQNYDIKRLEIVQLSFAISQSIVLSSSLPNLREFRIDLDFPQKLDQLRKIGKNWKLQSFSGNFSLARDKITLFDIFEMVEDNWDDTLENLKLSFPHRLMSGKNWETISNFTIYYRLKKLKALKKIKLHSIIPISVDFLLPCSETLEDIWVDCIEPSQFKFTAQDHQIVEFLVSQIMSLVLIPCKNHVISLMLY